jgi:glutathione synthase/RimK-type ligase-like ATP-grasp enzyme
MLRKWKEWDFKANFSWWWSVFPYKLNQIEKQLSIKSAKIIWLNLAWVDLLFDKDNWYKVCEVNASPWWKWLEQTTWINIAWKILDYIEKIGAK